MKFRECPFCGSNEVFFYKQSENTSKGFIWCRGCDFSSDVFNSEKVAFEKWDRRATNKKKTLKDRF